MPAGRSGEQDSAGFTLIEVLTALAALAMVVLLLSQGVQFGLLTWSRETRVLAGTGDLDATDRVLRRLVEGIDPGGMHGVIPRFQGAAHGVAFTSALTLPLPGLAARVADLALTAHAGSGLELSVTPHVRRLPGSPPAPERLSLLPGVVRLDMAYAGEDGRWRETWDGPPLPRLLRIRLSFATGDPRHWPDLVLAPMRDSWRP